MHIHIFKSSLITDEFVVTCESGNLATARRILKSQLLHEFSKETKNKQEQKTRVKYVIERIQRTHLIVTRESIELAVRIK